MRKPILSAAFVVAAAALVSMIPHAALAQD